MDEIVGWRCMLLVLYLDCNCCCICCCLLTSAAPRAWVFSSVKDVQPDVTVGLESDRGRSLVSLWGLGELVVGWIWTGEFREGSRAWL